MTAREWVNKYSQSGAFDQIYSTEHAESVVVAIQADAVNPGNFLFVSEPLDPTRFDAPPAIKADFNMELILQADKALLDHWKQQPFTLELDDHGRIIARYIVA